jgi:hypothetical protein
LPDFLKHENENERCQQAKKNDKNDNNCSFATLSVSDVTIFPDNI